MELTTSDARVPPPERFFLLAVLLVSGTVTVPQVLDLGFMTGLGFWTMAISTTVWGLWLIKPRIPRGMRGVVVPLAAFAGFGACSPVWGVRDSGTVWIQLLIVLIGFAGFVLLTARECADKPIFREAILRSFDFASITAAIGYTLTIVAFGAGEDAEIGGRTLFAARSFALFSIIAVARQLARWHMGERAGLPIAIWLTALVIVSQSRLGTVTILALYPISCFLVGGARKTATGLVMLVLGSGTMIGLLTFSQKMYDRFFGYDASLNVGGVAINAMGRTAAWTALLDDIRVRGGLFFGHGSGAASNFCSANFVNLPHPHNDYIRFLYDFGLFGLGWFLLFSLIAMVALFNALRRALRSGDRLTASMGLTALPALAGILVSMLTDNSAQYVFIMAPLGILIGATLASSAVRQTHRAVATDWIFAPDDEDDEVEAAF